jgi:hypothetical protein
MVQRGLRGSVSRDENALSFARSSAPDCGATALNLVYQAAEVFGSMEEHARETEARARSLCKSAAERLKLAEKRTETAQRECREIIIEIDFKEPKLRSASAVKSLLRSISSCKTPPRL